MSDHLPDDVVLRAEHVSVDYKTPRGIAHAVTDVSFDLHPGETLGIVGESGCGKSSLARALLQLPRPTHGRVLYRDVDLTTLTRKQLRGYRPELQMVFQDPTSSLNPRRTIRQSLYEPLKVGGVPRGEWDCRVDKMLSAVGLSPSRHGSVRPGELSGGQCQRASLARALLSGACVLICDEAVSALDVSLRATVLNLINDLKQEFGFAVLFIGHDLAVVKNVSDRVLVMYMGVVCEMSASDALYAQPMHPYTEALLSVVPEPDPERPLPQRTLTGELPSPLDPPTGCRFRSRCTRATDVCEIPPNLIELTKGHDVACHFPLQAPAVSAAE